MNWLPPRLPTAEPTSHSGGLGLHAALASDPPWESSAFSRPRYRCTEAADALKLVIHLPEADPSGIDLELAGPDLTITAPRIRPASSKSPFSDHDSAGRDYQLRLRLGFHLDYEALQTNVHAGILTITIPKMPEGPAADEPA
jgi:HSP20 family molecular chaperone IbpA